MYFEAELSGPQYFFRFYGLHILLIYLSCTNPANNLLSMNFSAALQTVHNLKVLLQNSPDGPSSKLQEYFQVFDVFLLSQTTAKVRLNLLSMYQSLYKTVFQNCSVNPASTIVERLNSLQDVFIRRFVSVTNQNQRQMAQQRYQLSVRLYFRVLEALLIAVSLPILYSPQQTG